jgi:succinate dehydrogenase hydrophobic anchor subunit
MSSRTVAKRGFNLDYIMWLFMRISALALYTIGLIGLIAAFAMGARTQTDISTLIRWVFFPNPNHVLSSDIINLDTWINSFWLVMEILAVFFGVTHGMNGLRIVVEDYMGHTVWRKIWRIFIFVLWLFVMLVAVYVVLAS